MKICELTDEQIEKIFDVNPWWVAMHHPYWTAHLHPEWMADHCTAWMADNHPKWMKENRPLVLSKLLSDPLTTYQEAEISSDILEILKQGVTNVCH